MPADDRSIAIAAALGLPVHRLRRLHFAMRGAAMVVRPEYEFLDADADYLVEVVARYANKSATTGAAAVATDAEHF